MEWKAPQQVPGKWDTSSFRNDPTNALPMPIPGNLGPGLWEGSPQRLKFKATGTDPVVSQAEWRSPIFDLQPWMRSSQNAQQGDSQPIWRVGQGAAGKLWIQPQNMQPVIVGIQSFGQLRNLRILAFEYAHINNINSVARITAETGIDVTSDVVGTKPSAIMQFYPTGEGYPVRFWQVRLLWQYTVRPGNESSNTFVSPITITSSYY